METTHFDLSVKLTKVKHGKIFLLKLEEKRSDAKIFDPIFIKWETFLLR